jgi:hypothetical protein
MRLNFVFLCAVFWLLPSVSHASEILKSVLPDSGASFQIRLEKSFLGAYIYSDKAFSDLWNVLQESKVEGVIDKFGTDEQRQAYHQLSERERLILEDHFSKSSDVLKNVERLRKELNSTPFCTSIRSSYQNGKHVLRGESLGAKPVLSENRVVLNGLGMECKSKKVPVIDTIKGKYVQRMGTEFSCTHVFADSKSEAAGLLERDENFLLTSCHKGPYKNFEGKKDLVPQIVWLDIYEKLEKQSEIDMRPLQWQVPLFRLKGGPKLVARDNLGAKGLDGKYKCVEPLSCNLQFQATSVLAGKIIETEENGSNAKESSCEEIRAARKQDSGVEISFLMKQFAVSEEPGRVVLFADVYRFNWAPEMECEKKRGYAIYSADGVSGRDPGRIELKLVHMVKDWTVGEDEKELPEKLTIERLSTVPSKK